eukprot:scaffold2739_cov301-Prasinococcus_capsulatus_cf.AAC.2
MCSAACAQVVNMWLVLYTWLQHTDVDIPHYAGEQWTWYGPAPQPLARFAANGARHGADAAALQGEGRAERHGGPAVRRGAGLPAPPHRQHARGAPPLLQDPPLPRPRYARPTTRPTATTTVVAS